MPEGVCFLLFYRFFGIKKDHSFQKLFIKFFSFSYLQTKVVVGVLKGCESCPACEYDLGEVLPETTGD